MGGATDYGLAIDETFRTDNEISGRNKGQNREPALDKFTNVQMDGMMDKKIRSATEREKQTGRGKNGQRADSCSRC